MADHGAEAPAHEVGRVADRGRDLLALPTHVVGHAGIVVVGVLGRIAHADRDAVEARREEEDLGRVLVHEVVGSPHAADAAEPGRLDAADRHGAARRPDGHLLRCALDLADVELAERAREEDLGLGDVHIVPGCSASGVPARVRVRSVTWKSVIGVIVVIEYPPGRAPAVHVRGKMTAVGVAADADSDAGGDAVVQLRDRPALQLDVLLDPVAAVVGVG